MALARIPPPVLLVIAVCSRHASALAWAEQQLTNVYGPVALRSPVYDFTQTSYYESTMGTGLRKQFLVFEKFVPPDQLAAIKRHTNDLEQLLEQSAAHPEARPLNLDPGILVLGKFMLATTKDQSHRLYLRDGIFAEVTLRYRDKAYEPWPWTYADYRQQVVLDFLNECRSYYRKRLSAGEV